ncbi:MAG: hypothetical protein K2X49_05165 [Acetobacteraceae bacterium]|nr:hypothetical protein [Acetobacteraceae bacterium]
MRTTILRLALLGTVASLPALAQISPATPDRGRAPAATEGSTRPGSPSVTPPAANAGMGNETRTDSVRPNSPNQGTMAGQGVGQGTTTQGTATPGTTMPAQTGRMDATGTDAARTGATSPNPRTTEGGQNAVQIDQGTRIGALEHGANSFTEGQARSRIEAAGFTNLNDLRKDDNGIWRGRAMRGGQQVEVGLDYRGNVAPLTR